MLEFPASAFRGAVACRLVVLLIALAAHAPTAPVPISGHVLDDNNAPVAGAVVTLTRCDDSTIRLTTASDPTGAFNVVVSTSADYDLRAEREGHFIVDQRVKVADTATELTITLPRRQAVMQSVDAQYSPAAVDPDRTFMQTLVTGTELLDVPYPKTNEIRNATRILPGVVQDVRGGLHMNGGTEEQVLYTLDGFIINDPLTGRLESRLSVEAVRAFELRSGSLPAEYGKGSAGVFSVRTEPGADAMRYTATNFVPGLENHKGLTIGAWTPRFGVSGPIRKGRAWVSNSSDVQYSNTVIDELEKGSDRSVSWRGSNMLRTQVNLTQANILNAGLLSTWWTGKRTGLSAIDPIETTADRRARGYFFNIKDQIAFHAGGLVEFGFATSRNFAREIPQGQGVQVFTPLGLRGNYGVNATRMGARDQFIVNAYTPSFQRAGRHQIKAGLDLDSLRYQQDAHRSGFDFLRVDGSVIRQTRFGGSGSFRNSSREVSSYVQDSWRLTPSFLIEMGLRQDWDSLVRDATISPRVGFAWGIAEITKVVGGFAVVYEPGNLRVFSEPLDQYSITTSNPSLDPSERLMTISRFAADTSGLRSPEYRTWNLGVERQWSRQIYSKVGYLRRRGHRGLTYVSWLEQDGLYEQTPALQFMNSLANLRRDMYDSIEAIVRQTFRTKYEWMAAYTRSRARSNAVTDVRVDTPVLAEHDTGPMPWDTPDRVVSWAYLPVGLKNWAAAYLLEYRTGQPFSIQDEQGAVQGTVNDHRFPAFFEMNAHLERSFSLFHNRWALRFGFNNVTGRKNPNVVINTIGSPQFMAFHGGQRRAFNLRIRWLGKDGR
jgi:hypothetical protein